MIQWFPGHMAKARREIEQNLKLVDLVIELVDDRAPAASQNPMLQELIKNKSKIIVLMKSDLADTEGTVKWIKYFQSQGILALAVNVDDKKDISRLVELVHKKGLEQQQKMMSKGVQQRSVRALIAGVPNVGKSTLINRLANKKIAKIGDRPGVTKQQQWIKVRKQFELLDTPGILWPKFEDQEIGYRLAAIGTIRDEILSLDDIAAYVVNYLNAEYPNLLEERYELRNTDEEDMWEIFQHIGRRRGCLESGGKVNISKTSDVILQDLRSGKLGKVTLETPTP